MKITPSNQTLILASERRGPASTADSSFGKLAVSTGQVLQRVTIVASQPDATVVYLRADYGAEADRSESTTYSRQPAVAQSDASGDAPALSNSPGGALVARRQDGGSRDAYGNTFTSRPDTGISSYLKPVEQYARTQRLLATSLPVQQIDVHA